ncbi:SulA-like leucine-rich domain-containing protein [Neptuniibacter sp.]|uniref:cell division inhibitor SulA n=1 Tax=Neptuniibacter sp. TaxID=1962643 RepID=UPI00261B9B21|nr:SulA-like leucine-rich domain-containing protein [Neptuniibacter sp.]MCP4598207.1 cell division inhibitor [Neptuniibacter sp.]
MLALQTNYQASSGIIRRSAAAHTATREKHVNQLAGTVTEIVVQGDDFNMPMLMPLLAQLSQDNRWFVWIAPPVLLPKQLLMEAGVDLNKVILLNPNSKHSTFALAKQALSTGTSHAVISWPGYLSDDELNDLESAAKQGQSHGIVIRRRQHS